MSQVYHKLYYHAAWSSHLRQPMITTEIEKVLYPAMENKAKRFHCHIFGINGTEDHTHMAISIPPSASVSDIIGKLKGSGSYFLNKELQITDNFQWQDGFGILSFAEKDLHAILKYIANQKEHHDLGKLNNEMEKMNDENNGTEK
ncbi:MAG: IS200/IS605 family transposase [Bacteroidota bacterium]|nr:IS200/IS605 family transposase [Bacteroidota bacterium]